jgi:hypothetical protein
MTGPFGHSQGRADVSVRSKPTDECFAGKAGMPTMRIMEMEKLMSGYHDLVDHGKREIYKLEG